MRTTLRLALTVVAFVLLLPTSFVRAADEPASLTLARRTVEAHRGDAHREKMRVVWPEVADETPPDGAEIVLVTGYISYGMTRIVLRDGRVEAGTVTAARSWFYNQEAGESFSATSFEVDAERFAAAWNAVRRILAATDERIEPEPDDHPFGGSGFGSSHESADWVRVRTAADQPPVHCADRPSDSYTWDDVREWSGLRDRAVFEVLHDLLPDAGPGRRKAAVSTWSAFAEAEIRAVARAPDRGRIGRDHEFLDSCLRVLGTAGSASSEDAVAALDTALTGLGDAGYWIESLLEEVRRAANRLRIRHHWDRDEAIRRLRAAAGTWAHGDDARWLMGEFRARDPDGWVAFLAEETTREEVPPDDVAAVAIELRLEPAEMAVTLLLPLLDHTDATVRLESAVSLHRIDPTDTVARERVVQLALDRPRSTDFREARAARGPRTRALAAALEWGALTPETLREYVLVAEFEDPWFLRAAHDHLADSPFVLRKEELFGDWRRLLRGPEPERVLAGVRTLVERKDADAKAALLAALDRLDADRVESDGAPTSPTAATIALWRERVTALPSPDAEK